MRDQPDEFRVTQLMREIPLGKAIAKSPFIQSYRHRIEYAKGFDDNWAMTHWLRWQ